QVVFDFPFRRRSAQPRPDLPQRKASWAGRQEREDQTLPLAQVPRNPLRWNIARREKPDRHTSVGVLDLRARQPGGQRQLRHLERAASPRLDDAAPVEDTGDERIPGEGLVRPEERLWRQSEVQCTRGGHFEPVVVDRDADRAAAYSIVAMAEG